jgi:protein-disulfide isomerase
MFYQVRRRSVFLGPLLSLISAVLLTACGAGDPANTFVQANQTAVAQSVEATLTANATATFNTAQPIIATPAQSRPPIRLPAPVPDWQAVARNPNAELGSPDAPVVLVEYSDFQCPWCGRFATQVMPQFKPLLEAGDVRFVYKHFPVLGDDSVVTAQATECAGQQGDFWTLHDWLFANQSMWKGGNVRTKVLATAAELGYDREALNTCMDDPATMQAISEDFQETQTYGFQGTPSFMLNGRVIPGFLSWEQFAPLIEVSKAEALGQKLPEGYVLAATPLPPDLEFEAEEFAVDGDPKAPVTVVEFSDYQCPFCLRFFQETKAQLDKRYIDTGKVRFIYKDFPIDSIHAQARVSALAAECAGAQGKYWEMHDRLFEGQSEWAEQVQAVDVLKGYGSDLGLDSDQFSACIDNESYAAEIQADLAEGQRAGVTGTPTFYINGRMLVGAQPLDVIVQIIEAELNK